MKSLFKGIWWIIMLVPRIIWKLRKVIVLAATALGIYKGVQAKRAVESDAEESTETSDS